MATWRIDNRLHTFNGGGYRMRLLKKWRILLYALPLLIVPATAQAVTVNIQINGDTVPAARCTTSGNTTTCDISGTWGGTVDVTGYPSGTPQVVFNEDNQNLPLLKLINAKFNARVAGLNGSVTFSVTPTAGRSSPKMVRAASGWLARTEGTTAAYVSPTNRGQFIVDGVVTSSSMTPNAESIDGISSGGDTAGSSKVVLSSAWAYGEIKETLFTKTEIMGSLSGSRTLKGEFTYYLPLQNDYLRLTQVKVETLDPAGPDVTDAASVGYTDVWDDDTGKCKCKGKDCMTRLCPGPDCPSPGDIPERRP